MKKFLLLLLTFILTFCCVACDFSQEGGSSNSDTLSSTGSESSDSSTSSTESSESGSSGNESQNGAIEKDFEINVTLSGESALEDNGYLIEYFSKKVTVTVSGEANVINVLSAEDITATVDVSNVQEKGDVELTIDYTAPDGVTIKNTSDSLAVVEITKKSVSVTPPSGTTVYISNGILVSDNRGMEQFGGSAAGGAKTAEKLNEFKQAVGEGVNVYIIPCPTASAFYAPDKYPNSIQNHINCFNGIRDNLVDVKYVDTLTALGNHTDEYIYYRTDFHWTGLGGYYAAQALAKVAGTPFDDISTYTENSVGGFEGALTRYVPALGNDPDDVYWYVPSREYTVTYYSVSGLSNPITGRTLFSGSNGYTKFIYGDSYTTHIQSNVGNGRKLLVFKDSYGNALAPYVMSSYDEVYICDIREFKLNALDFIEEHGITDVAFAMSAFAVNGSKRDYITKLLNY